MLGESEATTGRASIEEIGRRRVFRRTAMLAFVLLVVQQPMVDAVRELRDSAAACAEPGRISLLVDFAFIVAYVVAAYRCFKYLRFLGFQPWSAYARIGATLVAVAGVLDVLEDSLLWRDFGVTSGACPGLSTGLLSWVMIGIWSAGVLVLLTCLLATSRTIRPKLRRASNVTFKQAQNGSPDKDNLVICCSGGGIRSASFCLGALQLLRKRGVYDRASSVVGVSGGGYMAAAFHILRQDVPDPYAEGKPELARLRRQTRYLLQGSQAKFRAVLSLLYGVSVNLLLIGITLRAVAWVLGWFLYDLGVVTSSGERLEVHWRPNGSWLFLGLSAALLLAGALLFVLEKIGDRFFAMHDRVRMGFTTGGGYALLAGVAVAVLLLAVPAGLYLLNRLPVDNASEQPTLPQALLNLVDPSKQGLASFIGLVIALIGLGRSVWKGLSVEGKDKSESSLRRRTLAFVRNKVAPWLASAIILVAAAIVLLRWTGGYATDASYRTDWSVALVLAGAAIGIKLLTDANRTSLHPYYRERLSTAYLVRRKPNGTAVSRDYSQPLTYSQWGKAPDNGGPRLVVAAVANVSDADFVPSQRGCVPFIFDPDQIGIVGDNSLPDDGRRRTVDYEIDADWLKREVTVPAAMAISGAAFSPLTGRANYRTKPVRLLLAVLNARLGVWLPNPYWHSRPVPTATTRRQKMRRYVRSLIDKPGAYRLLREAIGTPSLYDRRLYVTDGGHYDNLGLVEALRRKPAQVIVIDASNDPEDRFSALAEAVATARMDHQIEIRIDPRPMRRGSQERAAQAWVYGNAEHPDGAVTQIYFLKALLTDNPSWDVEHYAEEHPDFPRRSTGDQFYGEWDFEAYRALGYTLAESMLSNRKIAAHLCPPLSEEVPVESLT